MPSLILELETASNDTSGFFVLGSALNYNPMKYHALLDFTSIEYQYRFKDPQLF